jgi:hypothetical protein
MQSHLVEIFETQFNDENIKMLRLSWNFNQSFSGLFQELFTLGDFFLSRTVKTLSRRMFIIFLNISDSALLKNIFENNHLLFSLIS